MSYDRERRVRSITPGGPFQAVDRTIAIMLSADARDPLDHSEYVIPAGTPMAPVARGSDHDNGLWLPIRRTRVATVATDPTTEFVVDDAEPFVVGDTIQAVDVAGPGTGVTDLGAITAITYSTNTIVCTNAADGLNVDDWIEVTENSAADDSGGYWYNNKLVGLLAHDVDVRIDAEDTDGQPTASEAVIAGSIRSADINFPTTAALDQILFYELDAWQQGGGIMIITAEASDEIVELPDTIAGS